MEIRLLTADAMTHALSDLTEVLRDCVEGGASVGFMLPFSQGEALAFWEGVQRAVAAGEVLLLVAEQAGRVVGTVQVGLKLPPNQPHRGEIKKLLVHTRARGQGLARHLMTAAEKAATEAGKQLLVLDTATGEPAEAIYERLGWSKAGVIPNYALFPDGRFCATTIFYKLEPAR